MLLLHWTGNCYGHKIIETVSIWLNLRHSSCDTVKTPILICYYWYCCLQLLSHSHIKNECVRLHVWVSEWAGKHKRVSCRTTPMKIVGFCFIFIFILNLTSPVHSKYTWTYNARVDPKWPQNTSLARFSIFIAVWLP